MKLPLLRWAALVLTAFTPLSAAEVHSITVEELVSKSEAHLLGKDVPKDYGQAYFFLKWAILISSHDELRTRLAFLERETSVDQKVEALKSLHVLFNVAAADGQRIPPKILQEIESGLTVEQRGDAMRIASVAFAELKAAKDREEKRKRDAIINNLKSIEQAASIYFIENPEATVTVRLLLDKQILRTLPIAVDGESYAALICYRDGSVSGVITKSGLEIELKY